MEFYKEGKVLTVANGTTLDLGDAKYNHKAAIIVSQNPSASADSIMLKFYTKGTKSAGVTFSAASIADSSAAINGFTNNLIPIRLAEINATTATAPLTVTLFN